MPPISVGDLSGPFDAPCHILQKHLSLVESVSNLTRTAMHITRPRFYSNILLALSKLRTYAMSADVCDADDTDGYM